MIRMHRRVSMAVAALALMAVVLTGCTSEASNIGRAKDKNGSEDVVDTGFTLSHEPLIGHDGTKYYDCPRI